VSPPTGRPDVVVVGLGPAGATAAYVLAKAGMKVLRVEGRMPGEAGYPLN